MTAPSREATTRSTSGARLRRLCLVAIGLLYVASVRWYRAPDQPFRLWLGLPDWVAVAVFCYVAVAVLNAFAWLATEIPDTLDTPDSSDPVDPPPGPCAAVGDEQAPE